MYSQITWSCYIENSKDSLKWIQQETGQIKGQYAKMS